MVNLGFDLDEIQGVDIVSDVNSNSLIDNIDLCVTIVSQVSYISLIRDTSVLMLGYTQLVGKGCCYEAFQEKKLEKQLVKAIERGLTARMKNKFVEHTARLLKYNLYDDMTIRELRFGRSVEDIDVTFDV